MWTPICCSSFIKVCLRNNAHAEETGKKGVSCENMVILWYESRFWHVFDQKLLSFPILCRVYQLFIPGAYICWRILDFVDKFFLIRDSIHTLLSVHQHLLWLTWNRLNLDESPSNLTNQSTEKKGGKPDHPFKFQDRKHQWCSRSLPHLTKIMLYCFCDSSCPCLPSSLTKHLNYTIERCVLWLASKKKPWIWNQEYV